jgi:hypothetical protein
MLLFPQNVVSVIGLGIVAIAWLIDRKVLLAAPVPLNNDIHRRS